jgi:hypothetical protein
MEYVSAPWEVGLKTHICVGSYNLRGIFNRDGSGAEGVDGSKSEGIH